MQHLRGSCDYLNARWNRKSIFSKTLRKGHFMAFKYVQRKKPQDEGECLAHETSRSGLNEIPFIVLSLSPESLSLFSLVWFTTYLSKDNDKKCLVTNIKTRYLKTNKKIKTKSPQCSRGGLLSFVKIKICLKFIYNECNPSTTFNTILIYLEEWN